MTVADRHLLIVRAQEVKPRPVSWLWEGRIPLGCVTLIPGQPGVGKSQLLALLAAQVSRGTLPGDLQGKRSSVVLITAEDAIAETATPRLIANNADLRRIVFTREVRVGEWLDTLDLRQDLEQLEAVVQRTSAALIGIDPFGSFLDGIDSHKDQEVRRGLAALAAMAEQRQVAVVGVMHLNKRSGESDALNRISGSIAWGALARSALMLGRDHDGGDLHLVHIKSNLAPLSPSQRCHIENVTIKHDGEPIPTSRLVIDGDSEVQATDLLNAPPSTEERTQRADAREFLLAELANGERPSTELFTLGEKQGFHVKTLRRAKDDIGAVAKQRATGWVWRLPDGADTGHTKTRRKAKRGKA